MSLTEEKRSQVIALARERPDLAVHMLVVLMEHLEKGNQLKAGERDEIILEGLNRWAKGQT